MENDLLGPVTNWILELHTRMEMGDPSVGIALAGASILLLAILCQLALIRVNRVSKQLLVLQTKIATLEEQNKTLSEGIGSTTFLPDKKPLEIVSSSVPVASPSVSGESENVITVPLRDKLQGTRKGLLARIKGLLSGPRKIDSAFLEELEASLISSDLGVDTTMRLVDDLKSRVKEGMEIDESSLKRQLHSSIVDIFNSASSLTKEFVPEKRADSNPRIVVLIGVNGAGKTTTVAKLAHRWVADGRKVLLAAGDTFRAAADAQLQVWADRIGVAIVTGKPNARPASVVFDALVEARSLQSDVLLVDTAGRLNNKSSLLQELQGIISVIKKQQQESPEEIWLVIDGTSGQNALAQAREFQKAVPITGVIITKLDGTAKGGIVVSIAHELKLPVKFVGVGETWADLRPFEPEPFAQALIQDE